LIALQNEYEAEMREYKWLVEMRQKTVYVPELRTRDSKRKGGIDWYIYRERILKPLLFPLALSIKETRPNVVIMEDNAPSHKHHYQAEFRRRFDLDKLEWPANSPDLNPIESIWNDMKDSIKVKLGWDFTARRIRALIEDEWKNYPVEKINRHIMSMPRRIEACIAKEGGNGYNF
jgi:transposase